MKGWRAFGLRFMTDTAQYHLTPLWRTDVENPWLGPVATEKPPHPDFHSLLGLWAMRTRVGVLTYLYWTDAYGEPTDRRLASPAVIGEVELAGRVIEHELGYRAEKAAIRSLQVWGYWPPDRERRIAESLAARYGCDVECLSVPERPHGPEVEATVDIMEQDNRTPVAPPHGLPYGAMRVLSRAPKLMFGRPATVRFMDGPLQGTEKVLDPALCAGGRLTVHVPGEYTVTAAAEANASAALPPQTVTYELRYSIVSDTILARVVA